MGIRRKLALAALALPACHFAAATELDPDNAVALLSCVPRTVRALRWAATAGWDYYQHLHTAHPTDWTAVNNYWATALTSVCKQNGGIYVKAAQMLSTFGAVPDEYRSLLGQLHDDCSPKPFSKIHKSLRNELGESYATLFDEIDENATAAASIAQVHQAELKGGHRVALKVQYPALKKAVTSDLNCLLLLSKISDFVFPEHPVHWMVLQLKRQIFQEMDFTIEAQNAQSLRHRMQHRSDIRIPEMFMELCTSHLLVMEWIEGCKLSDRRCLRFHGINPRSVALTLLDAFSEMTLVHGFIHGDPHPGNLLVIPTPYEERQSWLWRLLTFQWRTPFQLVLLDHGRYLEMDHATRLDYCVLWCSLVRGDQSGAIAAATRMCHGDSGGRLLPTVLYRPFDRQTRQRIRTDTSLADVIGILHTAPQTLVDALRIVAVVRHVAAAIADIKSDRAYIEGSRAWDGLTSEEALEPRTWRIEIRLKLRLLFMRMGMWLRDVSYSWELFTALA